MKERPILFSAPMVLAILEGRKTQTRRALNPQPTTNGNWFELPGYATGSESSFRSGAPIFKSKFGHPGDRLWIRETWARDEEDGTLLFRADNNEETKNWDQQRHESGLAKYNWKPSIFMPRWASRILLEITSVRVERLKDISEADAKAEGCEPGLTKVKKCHGWTPYVLGYSLLWESINGPRSWNANPWVWVIEFKRIIIA